MSRAGELSFGELASATPTADTGPRSDRRDTTGPQWRQDTTGRTRFRGQPRRGRVSRGRSDAADVAFALRELATAHAELTSVDAMPAGRARREAHKAAISKVGLAGRMLDEVLDRSPLQ